MDNYLKFFPYHTQWTLQFAERNGFYFSITAIFPAKKTKSTIEFYHQTIDPFSQIPPLN